MADEKKTKFIIFDVELDDLVTTYYVCVPEDQVDEFLEDVSNSKNVLSAGPVIDTETDEDCCFIYDHGNEYPTGYCTDDEEEDYEYEEEF